MCMCNETFFQVKFRVNCSTWNGTINISRKTIHMEYFWMGIFVIPRDRQIEIIGYKWVILFVF